MNLISAPDAYDTMISPKNISLFEEFGIYSSIELYSRYEILNEEYSKTIHIEALTLIDMINRQVLPAVMEFATGIALGLESKKKVLPDMAFDAETDRLAKVESLASDLHRAVRELEKSVAVASEYEGSSLAHFSRNEILPAMEEVRRSADELELIVGQKSWPYPTYGEMLFYID